MRRMNVLRALTATSVALLAGVPAAQAGPSGQWTQVTGVGQDDANTMRPGLARTGDGVLHVSWTRDIAGSGSLLHSSISADAKSVAGPATVFSNNTYGVDGDSDLVVAPDGSLRAFFTATNVFDNVLATATSADGGASWAVGGPASKTGAAGKDVYTAIGIGAAAGNGTFYSIWGDSSPDGGGYHVGLDPNAADGELPDGLQTETNLAVDSVSGQVISAWNSLDNDRVELMPIAPAGAPSTVPTPSSGFQGSSGITGRIGAPGVFVAYGRGSNPFLSDPSVYRVDTGTATRLTKKDGEMTSIAAAPGGRLWVFWKVDGTIYATRSNPDATKWGEIVSIKPPQKSQTIYNLTGDATLGPLDLLAAVETPSGSLASWHQRILPGIAFKAGKAGKGKTAITVTDAGKALGGVKVQYKGKGKANKGSKTTGASGKVSFSLEKGRYKVTVSKKGYASLTKKLRVK